MYQSIMHACSVVIVVVLASVLFEDRRKSCAFLVLAMMGIDSYFIFTGNGDNVIYAGVSGNEEKGIEYSFIKKIIDSTAMEVLSNYGCLTSRYCTWMLSTLQSKL